MSDLQNLQELLELLKKQEEMIGLMEKLQSENEKLERELKACKTQLAQKTKKLKETQSLNETLNSEHRRLIKQIERWRDLND